jgi:hypothetical protein
MVSLEDLNIDKLTKDVYDLIAKASIEMGHRTDGKTMAVLAKTFAADLQQENRFRRLYWTDVTAAFRNGVRAETEQQYLSIPTFYRWLRKQKELISRDIYAVRTLNCPIEKAPLYRDTTKNKLITTKNLKK